MDIVRVHDFIVVMMFQAEDFAKNKIGCRVIGCCKTYCFRSIDFKATTKASKYLTKHQGNSHF